MFSKDLKFEIITNKESITDAIYECQDKSMPKNKNIKLKKELDRINVANDEKPLCYGEVYDIFAKRYGYNLDEFYNLTTRQIHALLKIIDKKTYDELSVEASLHGVKLKERIQYNEEFSDKEVEKQEKQAIDFLKRARKEYEEKVKNGKRQK